MYGDFLINGPNCKIPNMSPFDKKAMKVFQREEFKACSSTRALTSVQNTREEKPKLIIHEDLRKDYVKWWQTDLNVSYGDKQSIYCEVAFLLIFLVQCKELVSQMTNENNT